MSTVICKNVQIGTSGTAAQNFTWYQPASPDGTVRLGVGNTGATTGDVVTANSAGNVGIGTSAPGYKLDVVGSSGIRLAETAAQNGFELAPGSTVITTAYNRTTNTWLALRQRALQHEFYCNGSETARLDSSGNLGIGTSSPGAKLEVAGGNFLFANNQFLQQRDSSGNAKNIFGANTSNEVNIGGMDGSSPFATIRMFTGGTERARIDSSGNLLVGKTTTSNGTNGISLGGNNGIASFVRDQLTPAEINRRTNDGTLLDFLQDGTSEGSVSVSGTTVSYNGGHLSRWAQTTGPKDDSLVKGTVLSNLDEMNQYTDVDGNPVPNEQLNKVKVSDVEGDPNVAGVFVNWTHDDAHNVDEINMAMTGDMIIRIAQGVTVQRGDLLMSAGDGTAKPQGDDIVRSKTVAKVTSTHITCTYEDGSYCVPCVLMAC